MCSCDSLCVSLFHHPASTQGASGAAPSKFPHKICENPKITQLKFPVCFRPPTSPPRKYKRQKPGLPRANLAANLGSPASDGPVTCKWQMNLQTETKTYKSIVYRYKLLIVNLFRRATSLLYKTWLYSRIKGFFAWNGPLVCRSRQKHLFSQQNA